MRILFKKNSRNPVAVSTDYLNIIKTTELLGKGFYGVVYKGYDKVLEMASALKTVDTQVLAASPASRADGVQKSFQNEMNVSTSPVLSARACLLSRILTRDHRLLYALDT